jgi:hypothetical protein
MKDTTIIVIVLILSVAAIPVTWIWGQHHRCRLVDATRASEPSERHIYELDCRTGAVWIITPGGREAVPEPKGCFWEVNSEGKHLRWRPDD